MNATHTASAQADGDPGIQTTADRVVAEIAAALDLCGPEVLPRCVLREDFGATERDRQNLREGLQLAFDITIPIDSVQRWRTVSDVIAYVDGRIHG